MYITFVRMKSMLSIFLFLLRLQPGLQNMPQNGTMNACNLYRVMTWIRQGYPNN
jgi:hypothetical protein